MRKIAHTILHWPCWDNIVQEYCLVNGFQIRLRQHCTRKLLVRCWPRAHRNTSAGKPAVWHLPGSLLFNWAEYHRTILALSVQCWLGSQQWTGTNIDWNITTKFLVLWKMALKLKISKFHIKCTIFWQNKNHLYQKYKRPNFGPIMDFQIYRKHQKTKTSLILWWGKETHHCTK